MNNIEKSKGKCKALKTPTTKFLYGIIKLFQEFDIVGIEMPNNRLSFIIKKENALIELNLEIEVRQKR